MTGREAVGAVQRLAAVVDQISSRLSCKPEEVPARLEALQEEVKKLQGQLKKGAAGDLTAAVDKLLASAGTAGGARVIVGEIPAAPLDQVRQQVDRLRTKASSAAIVLAWVEEGKVQIQMALTDDVVKKGLDAGKGLVQAVTAVVGGKGGGRPNMAQGSGSDPARLGEALELARKLIADKLK